MKRSSDPSQSNKMCHNNQPSSIMDMFISWNIEDLTHKQSSSQSPLENFICIMQTMELSNENNLKSKCFYFHSYIFFTLLKMSIF